MRLPSTYLLLLLPVALGAHLRLSIPSSTLLPNPSFLPASTSATLTTLGSIITAPLRSDNTFDFRNVSTGSYLLDVHCHTHAFRPLRVDVHSAEGEEKVEVWGTFRGNEWSNKGEVIEVKEVAKEGIDSKGMRVWGFEGKVAAGKEYLMERSGFSPLSILKNPMILIAIVSMGIVFGMPYLMDNMDPEMREEFEARSKTGPLAGGPQANPLQGFDAAAWLAGSAPKKSDSAPAAQGKITR